MKRLSSLLFFAGLLASLAGLCTLRQASACAPVMGAGGHVAIAGESAIIIWDEKTRTEHFIRRASFETQVPYFGFLVPTPAQPTLAEAPDEVFATLEDWSKPEVVTKAVRRPRTSGWGLSRGLSEGAPKMAPAGAVEVLQTQHVGGYKADILKASDAKALKEWLDQHGYVTRPDLEKWLEPYVKGGWIITAFQIAKTDKKKAGLSTQAVRMSFKTDRPFYPYAEPGDQRAAGGFRPGRLLRIFVVAPARMEGRLDHPTTAWPGRAAWANTLADDRREKLAARLGGSTPVSMPEKPWMTVFEDSSSPRPGVADLFFSAAAEQSPLARPPIINYVYTDEAASPVVWWGGVLVLGSSLLVIGMVFAVWRFALRGQAPAT
jgi:hypothetical protein